MYKKKFTSLDIKQNHIQFHICIVVVACNGNKICKELDLDEDNSPGCKLFPGAVVASSGVVVTGEGCLFLIFLNGFCREDGGDKK
ncbi:hypothetical protein MtrunA17_Chr6g0468321 [Medicago truncatula]|uniref:Uncharacterized protein n=1 Tax=Medicago truncatula TaxID=3880 RepID=A0A396HKK5_MEDTR|nr:hypothetical protein MtrunA17_Chr6g0468321 [Medicago truncatula]